MRKKISLLSIATLLTSCTFPSIPLDPVKYDKPVHVTSAKNAMLELATETTIFDVGGGYCDSYPLKGSWAHPTQHFNTQDQQIFMESLKSELKRLKLLNVLNGIKSNSSVADIKVKLTFEKALTCLIIAGGVQYTLNVELEIEEVNKKFANHYYILSSINDSPWETGRTDHKKGKQKAAKILLEAVIADIERWIASN